MSTYQMRKSAKQRRKWRVIEAVAKWTGGVVGVTCFLGLFISISAPMLEDRAMNEGEVGTAIVSMCVLFFFVACGLAGEESK